MKRQAIDVEVEIPFKEVEEYGNTVTATRVIVGLLRRKAEAESEKAHGQVVPTILPEIVVKRTSSILLGGDILLVAARWWVDVPESFVPAGR